MRYLLTIALLLGSATLTPVVSHAQADTDWQAQHASFLSGEDVRPRLRRLLELERQAHALIEDEPLKLGSLGAAITELYPGSQTGHLALSRYYEHLEAEEAQANHDNALEAIQQTMRESGDGGDQQPFRVMTIYDAQTFALSNDMSPVGSIYQSSKFAELGYLLVARPEGERLRQVFFDLSHLLPALSHHAEGAEALSAWGVIRVLASDMDTAAQTAIGAYLTNTKKYEDALSWLKVASRTGNILANTLLARIYWTQSEAEAEPEKVTELLELALENYLHAITLGSTDAMYTLANLYMNGYYGDENRIAAIPLLEQAADIGHVDAVVYLAHMYSAGEVVEQSTDQAREYFRRAVAEQHDGAAVAYARFLITEGLSDEEDASLFSTLRDMADEKNPQAMIVLGNLHARDIAPDASIRRAVRWYKRALKAAPEDADVVNEVVWTLTVSDVEGLKREKFARKTMDRLMNNNDEARTRPEYLDTWAATYAATGDFARAVELQQQAISQAVQQSREDVLNILQGHLELFEMNKPVIEAAP